MRTVARRRPDWRMVAVHNERAERFDEAASAYQLAATEARRRGALAEARGVVDAAIAEAQEHPQARVATTGR